MTTTQSSSNIEKLTIKAGKSLVFDVFFKGNGNTFNFEGSGQGSKGRRIDNCNLLQSFIREGVIACNQSNLYNAKDAVKFSKKHIFPDGSYVYEVTPSCLGREIYKGSMICELGSALCSNLGADYKLSLLADPFTILHGYMIASKDSSLQKDGALCLSPAREVDKDGEAITPRRTLIIEIGSATPIAGEGSSLFSRDGLDCSEYLASKGCVLKLDELELLVNDYKFGRNNLLISDFNDVEKLVSLIKENLGESDVEYGVYKKHNLPEGVGEYAVKLGTNAVVALIKKAFKAILSAEWNKKTGSMRTDYILCDGKKITADNIDSFAFEFVSSYDKVEDESSIEVFAKAKNTLVANFKKAKEEQEKSESESNED